MESILSQALSPDPSIRLPAESLLKSAEKTPGFLIHLLHLADTSPNTQLKIFALILSKSVITRQWHILATESQPVPISSEEKLSVKTFLMQKIFLSAPDMTLTPHYILCLDSVSKYDFYEAWPELVLYFNEKVKSLNEVDIKVLKTLVKTQIKKRTKFRQFRDWVLGLYPYLRPMWRVVNSPDFDKIVIKCLTVKNDPEVVLEFLALCKELSKCPDGENRLRVILKGINLIENIFPTMFSGKVLEVYLDVNYTIITNIDLNSDKYFAIVRQVVYNIRQIIETNDQAQQMMKPFALPILQKAAASFKSEPFWEDWAREDYLEVLCRKKEENCTKKLAVTLMTVYPELKDSVYSLIYTLETMQFDQLYISLNLISLLAKVNKNTQNEELLPELVMEKVLNLKFEGVFLKIVWKTVLGLVRKSLSFVRNFFGVFEKVCWVKGRSGEDSVLVYECCLTAKEMMNFNVGEEIRGRIIEEFEPIRFEIKERIGNVRV